MRVLLLCPALLLAAACSRPPKCNATGLTGIHSSFLGLYGDAAAIEATVKEFKAFYRKQTAIRPTTYSVDHTAGSYVFDPSGRLRLYLRHGETPERIARDLRRLLASE